MTCLISIVRFQMSYQLLLLQLLLAIFETLVLISFGEIPSNGSNSVDSSSGFKALNLKVFFLGFHFFIFVFQKLRLKENK